MQGRRSVGAGIAMERPVVVIVVFHPNGTHVAG
jgi:hypothetical protein